MQSSISTCENTMLRRQSFTPLGSILWVVATLGVSLTGSAVAAPVASSSAASCGTSIQCDNNALRNVPTNACNKPVSQTTCNDPVWNLRYRVFMNFQRPLLFQQLKAMEDKLKNVDAVHDSVDAAIGLATSTKSLVDAFGINTTKDALITYSTTALSVYPVKSENIKAILGEVADAVAISTSSNYADLGVYIATKSVKIISDSLTAWATLEIANARADSLVADSLLQEYFRSCGSQAANDKITTRHTNLSKDKAHADRFVKEIEAGKVTVESMTNILHNACQAQCRQVCKPNTSAAQSCTVTNGSGTATNTCAPDGTKWSTGVCTAVSCNQGYRLAGGSCIRSLCTPGATATQSCAVSNGSGSSTNTCAPDGSKWMSGNCSATACTAGFALVRGACVKTLCRPNQTAQQSCAIANGGGIATSMCTGDGSKWVLGACKAVSCNAGYKLAQNACVKR